METLEYYNVKKVIIIQAHIRGFLVRRKYKDYVEKIKRAPYRHKILKKSKILNEKIQSYFDRIEMIKDIEKKIYIT